MLFVSDKINLFVSSVNKRRLWIVESQSMFNGRSSPSCRGHFFIEGLILFDGFLCCWHLCCAVVILETIFKIKVTKKYNKKIKNIIPSDVTDYIDRARQVKSVKYNQILIWWLTGWALWFARNLHTYYVAKVVPTTLPT